MYFFQAAVILMNLWSIFSSLFKSNKIAYILGGVLVMIFSSSIGSYSASTPATDQWLTPMEAYGISGDINDSNIYTELMYAFETSPPSEIELTLIAIGRKDFQELQAIENQKITSKYGYTEIFYVSGNFEEFSLQTSISLHFEEGEEEGDSGEKLLGWYAHSFGTYYPNNGDTVNKNEDLEEQEYEKCNIFTGHLGEENNKYKDYIEENAFYIEIPLPFGFHLTGGKDTPNRETKVLARIDNVKREMEVNNSIYERKVWELQRIETYYLKSDNKVGTRVKFNDNFVGKGNYVDSDVDLTINVSKNTIEYTRTTHIKENNESKTRIEDYTISFGEPPTFLKPYESIRLSISEVGSISGFDGVVTEYSKGLACAGFLLGIRPETYITKESDKDTIRSPYGTKLDQRWFANVDGYLQNAAPMGEIDGKLMTLELGFDMLESYDSTESFHQEIPVIAYIYKWKEGNVDQVQEMDSEVSVTDLDAPGDLKKDKEESKIGSIEMILTIISVVIVAIGIVIKWRRR